MFLSLDCKLLSYCDRVRFYVYSWNRCLLGDDYSGFMLLCDCSDINVKVKVA